MRPSSKLSSFALLALIPLASIGAQGRVITQADYDIWKAIQSPTLSRDGQWLAYTLSPQVGDGELVIRSTAASTEHRVPRGFTGRPQLQPNVDSGFTAPPPQFSYDGRAVVAMTYATRAEFERASRARRGAPTPRGALAIVSLPDGKVTSVPRVRSFAMPREAGGWIAYLLEPTDSAGRAPNDSSVSTAPNAAAATPGGTPRPIAGAGRARGPETGSTLVVRDLASGAESRIEDVTAYAFADSGRWLGYTVASRTDARNGAYVRALGPSGVGAEVALLSGKGRYRGLAFDRAERQVAFVSDRDDAASAKPKFTLYEAALGTTVSAKALVTPAALRSDVVLSERGVSFTRDGSAVQFGLAPVAPDSIPADSLADKAVFDLWNYKDARLQPQQKIEVGRDRTRTYTALYALATGKWVQLANDTVPQVTLSDDARMAIGTSSLPYALAAMWGEEASDAYLIDARTGARKLVASKLDFRPELSPTGRYVLWFGDKQWHAYDAKSGKTVDLTSALKGVRFAQEETWDWPKPVDAWGVGGWTPDDRSVLLYSRYDVWELDPLGIRPARVVTDSAGARAGVQLRIVQSGGTRGGRGRGPASSRVVDPTQPLLLSAFDVRTKQAGFWRDRLDANTPPERIVMSANKWGTPIKAADADVYAVTRESFTEFPNVWVGVSLDKLTKVTDANPQQSQYAWGSAEPFEWTSADGKPLQGVLYKPANFDPSKKYPMLVTYYEQMSQNLYGYEVPAGRNRINPAVYASNGYVVFTPDIAYTTGYPGQSALNSVVPGVQAIVARGFVDGTKVGIGGQSWGGYQSAYIVTQTPMFAAAFLGAPVANMTSAYGGIRWESGLARAFQYEHDQSRIGASIWDAPMRYIENSPLFYIPRVRTPVLIMSNDADGAVPWYQGIELFVAMKRFGKEAYLVEYNNEGHNPRKRANQLDIDRRMQQFFANKLKGAAAPEWMTKGIPFLDKGRDQLIAPNAAMPNSASGGTSQNPR